MQTKQADNTKDSESLDSACSAEPPNAPKKEDKPPQESSAEIQSDESTGKSGFSFFGLKGMVGVATAMVTFGQFNDTKELLTSLYENVTTNFTHSIQYTKLDELAIGRTIGYVEDFFGPPEVIKTSPSIEGLVYQYYNIEKAIICIMNYGDRVAGFVVIPVADDFTPTIRYSSFNLGNSPFSSTNEEINGVFFDANNLVYYSEAVDLGKQYMFLQQVTGYVEYGNLITSVNEVPIDKITTIELISQINDLFLSDNTDELDTKISDFRETHSANFFAYTELDAGLISESLLTRFEFKSYFGADDE